MKIMMVPAKRALAYDEVKNFSGQWQYYIRRELEAMGHQIVFERGALPNDPPQVALDYFRKTLIPRAKTVDHVLGMSRYFTRVPARCVQELMGSINGAVTQIHDGPLPGVPCDQVFSIRHHEGTRATTHIGWGVDPDVIPSRQGKGLRILIDHPHYHEGMVDTTNSITHQALAFRDANPALDVSIGRFCDGGVEEITDYAMARSFNRVHVPFAAIAEQYSRAHIFLPTHMESLGLSVLEAAVAGALVVSRKGFIRDDLLKTVRNLVYYDDHVPFEMAVPLIDIAAARRVASMNTWRVVTEKIVHYFEGFKR